MGVVKCLLTFLLQIVLLVLVITFIPGIPPQTDISQSYKVAPSRPLTGKLALNDKLDNVEHLFEEEILGPESFAEHNGELYTTLATGEIVKIKGKHIVPIAQIGKPCKGIYQEHICGRPLGLRFDQNGDLFVADAYYGIYKIDVKTGDKVKIVSSDEEIGGKKSLIPNSLTIACNGDIYWTDSSTEFHLSDGVLDLLSDGSGRLIHYDAKLRRNTVLMDKLHFANGVILSDDEEFLLVNELVRGQIHRYYLKGPKKGTHDVFIEGLPGLPDNLQSDGKDGFLMTMVLPVDADHPQIIQIFGPFPLVRRFFVKTLGLLQAFFKMIDHYYPNDVAEQAAYTIGSFAMTKIFIPDRLTVLHVSKSGEILDSLHSTKGKTRKISEAFIHKDHLYLASPWNDYLGRISLDEVGWGHLRLQPGWKLPQCGKADEKTTAPPTKKATTTTVPPSTSTTTTTPKPTTTTQKPTTTTPKATTTAAPTTTTTAKPTTTTKPPVRTTTTPKPTTTTQPPTVAAKSVPKQESAKTTESKTKQPPKSNSKESSTTKN